MHATLSSPPANSHALLPAQLTPTVPPSQPLTSQPPCPSLLSCQCSERTLLLQVTSHFAHDAHMVSESKVCSRDLLFSVEYWFCSHCSKRQHTVSSCTLVQLKHVEFLPNIPLRHLCCKFARGLSHAHYWEVKNI